MKRIIRTATKNDLPAILAIYARAREFMASTGNPTQWGTTYPEPALLESDIQTGNLYVAEGAAGIQGVFAFFQGVDTTYLVIEDGAWHSELPYGTIHRVASDGSKGVFADILEWCRGQNQYLRIDTHSDNKVMQHVVEKAGFQRCGKIYTFDGTPRIAYDFIAE